MIDQTGAGIANGSANGTVPLKTLVEAFVLVSDGPVAIEILAAALEREPAEVENALAELDKDYQGRGIRLQRMRERVQFVSAPEVSEQVQKFLGLDIAPRLSPASLETLAIIAYRQPITRPQMEAIRGVNCDGVIHTLLARNLIESVGQLETVGHPTLYGTTFDFLQYFGLTALEQLPPLPSDMIPVLPDPGALGLPVEPAATASDSPETALEQAALDESAESEPNAANEMEAEIAAEPETSGESEIESGNSAEVYGDPSAVEPL